VRSFKLLFAIAILAAFSLNAQVSVYDASDFITENKKETSVQSNIETYEFELFNETAEDIFNNNKNHIVINNFPLRPNYKVNLILSKQKSTFANDIEINYFKDGKKLKYNRVNKSKYFGFIEGAVISDVYLSYTSLGLVGYIQDETGQIYDVNADYNDLNNSAITHNVSETTMGKLLDNEFVNTCGIDALDYDTHGDDDFTIDKSQNQIQKTDLLEVNVAADGNFEYYLMFAQFITNGNRNSWETWFDSMTEAQHEQALENCIDYIENVMSASSRIYTREVAIILKVPYLTIFNDPFEDPYFDLFGEGLQEKLSEMPSIWSTRVNEAQDRVIATVFTDNSRQPAGSSTLGIARAGNDDQYKGVLCDKNSGFSALGMLGRVNFPRVSFSQDVQVAAHEFGHNFGCPHTHSCFWVDRGMTLIDSCVTEAEPGDDSRCLKWSERVRKTDGTIMSYCHQNGSIIFEFHPRNRKRIRDNAEKALEFCIKVPTDPVVRLIRPLGDEVYFAGNEISIAFNAANVPQSKLLYSDNLGANWTEIGTVNTAVDTVFNWILPLASSTQSMIRIESSTDSEVFDQSELPFLITDFSITPEFPKPNEKVGYLTEHRLSWVRKNVKEVRVKLSLDNGQTFNEIASGDLTNYNYDFPDVVTNEAILLIESMENSDVNVEIPFELGKEHIEFNSPMMDDTLNVNRKEHKIKFGMSFLLEEFDILFRKNQTGEWIQLTNFAKKVDLENNEFTWTFAGDIVAGDLGELRAEVRNSDEIIGESGVFKFEAFTSVSRSYSNKFNINSITPNPAGSSFQLVINNADGRLVNTNLRIIGVDGKEYRNTRIGFISTGKTPQEIDVHDLPVGTYYLMIESDKYKDVQKLIIVR